MKLAFSISTALALNFKKRENFKHPTLKCGPLSSQDLNLPMLVCDDLKLRKVHRRFSVFGAITVKICIFDST